jgi:hypothetical protein
MKRVLVVFVAAFIAAGVALAAVKQHDAAGPPTSASLMPAYVQAAKYWSDRPARPAIASPPTTASLMPAYAQAYWQGHAPASLRIESPAVDTSQSPPTTASLMSAYVQAARLWRR